ncbi:MAG TPA: hypothetical protein VK188_17335 [Holophaga sp.]|nr:hypothetical protein [Holophaga sp.]
MRPLRFLLLATLAVLPALAAGSGSANKITIINKTGLDLEAEWVKEAKVVMEVTLDSGTKKTVLGKVIQKTTGKTNIRNADLPAGRKATLQFTTEGESTVAGNTPPTRGLLFFRKKKGNEDHGKFYLSVTKEKAELDSNYNALIPPEAYEGKDTQWTLKKSSRFWEE